MMFTRWLFHWAVVAGLQHFVGTGADTGHKVARCEGGLFHIGEEVFGIAVQLEFAHFNQLIEIDLSDLCDNILKQQTQ